MSSLLILSIFSAVSFSAVAKADAQMTVEELASLSPEKQKAELDRQKAIISQIRTELANAEEVEKEDGSIIYKIPQGLRIATGIAAVASFGAITLALYARGTEIVHGHFTSYADAYVSKGPFSQMGSIGVSLIVPATAAFLFTWATTKLIEKELIITKAERKKLDKALGSIDLTFDKMKEKLSSFVNG